MSEKVYDRYFLLGPEPTITGTPINKESEKFFIQFSASIAPKLPLTDVSASWGNTEVQNTVSKCSVKEKTITFEDSTMHFSGILAN